MDEYYEFENGMTYMMSFEDRNFITSDKTAVLNVNPHHTNEKFRKPQIVFGREIRGLMWVYSDRIWQWDYQKAEEAKEKANQSGARNNTCTWFEAYLSAYFDRNIQIDCIKAGWNWATGFPYQIFGYQYKPLPTSVGEEE